MTDAATPDRGHRWFAVWYDRLNARAERGALGRARRELLAGAHGDVIEIGAGTGANFAHYPGDAKVIALEPDPYMLKRAQARLDTLGRDNIELRAAPAEALPFPDASFDYAVSTLVLCTVNDPARSLAEIRRVLRPDGRLLFIEHVRAAGAAGRLQDVIRPVWSWGGAGCQINRRTLETLRSAGFDVSLSQGEKPIPLLPAIMGSARVSS